MLRQHFEDAHVSARRRELPGGACNVHACT
ncbi:MAG: hypothetical protein JWP87_2073, partial [Labilithrix sp.]|nr:hypothetical protein [Labilithrix sp.]